MAPPTSRAADNEPLLRPTPNDLALAPELGVLAALDATAATAAYQLTAEHPDLDLDALARGDTPCVEARKASALVLRIHGLRAVIRQYRELVLHPERHRDQLPLPF
ncbi:MAG TPA: hypothetical protein VLV56_04195 [Burkholderiales bacterium]|nr:hypothetical protein [Burkholderiales bacterium]